MKFKKSLVGTWSAIALSAVTLLSAGAASAMPMTVSTSLGIVSSDFALDPSGNAGGALGFSHSNGNFAASLDFMLGDIDSTDFNAILLEDSPFELSVTATTAPRAQIKFSELINGPADLGNFLNNFVPLNDAEVSVYHGIASATSYDSPTAFATLTNLTLGQAPGAGSNQITGGTFNFVATFEDTPQNSFVEHWDGELADYPSTLTLQQVATVPGPSGLAMLMFALGLLGMGFYRTKTRKHGTASA